jgi:hypothetical protein
MIKSINIKNYQGHVQTFIEFVAGVNVITGASDAWNRRNRPLGNAIKNWNHKNEESVVDVEFFDGIISQKRLDNGTEYNLKLPVVSKLKRGNKKYEETSFSALNKDIPEEITAAYDMNEINVQSQHENYFMLDDAPGVIAQKLNALAGLDIIDKMFKNINSFILHDKREADKCVSEIKGKKEELQKLEYIDQAKIDVQNCQVLIDKKETLTNANTEMLQVVGNLNFFNSEIEKTEKVVLLESDLAHIKEQISRCEYAEEKIENLDRFHDDLESIISELEGEKEWIKVEKPFVEIQSLISRLGQKKESLILKEKVQQTLQSLGNNIERENNRFEEAKAKYKESLSQMKICPVCKGKIDTKCVEKIMEEL